VLKSCFIAFFASFILSCTSSTDPNLNNLPTPRTFLSYDSVFANSIFSGDPSIQIQDFAFDGQDLYLHPIGPFGLYRFSFSNRTFDTLAVYSSGDYLAFDSAYVFYEVGGFTIRRFNLAADSTDLSVTPSVLGLQAIGGMEIHDGNLLAVFQSVASGNRVLARFDGNLSLIDTIPYGRQTLHMGVGNDIVYAISTDLQWTVGTVALTRFSLTTRSFLTDLLFPTTAWNGIRVYGDTLYFADSARRQIMSLPVTDLMK